MEDTILFPSCFDANAGIFEALLTDKDAVRARHSVHTYERLLLRGA